jgi:hypothetical protein
MEKKMQAKKAKLIPKNKILSVTVKRVLDNDPDTSWLGEYSNRPTSEYSIDRAHAEDCASVSLAAKQTSETLEHAQQTVGEMYNAVLAQYNGTLANEKLDQEREALDEAYDLLGSLADEVVECDCNERGNMERGQYRYFNPSFNYVDKNGKPTDGLTPEEVRKYTRQDYERLERLNSGDWCFIGIAAEAQIGIPQNGSYLCQTLHSGGLYGIESDSERSHIESEEKNQLADLRDVLKSFGFSSRAISQAFKSIERKES